MATDVQSEEDPLRLLFSNLERGDRNKSPLGRRLPFGGHDLRNIPDFNPGCFWRTPEPLNPGTDRNRENNVGDVGSAETVPPSYAHGRSEAPEFKGPVDRIRRYEFLTPTTRGANTSSRSRFDPVDSLPLPYGYNPGKNRKDFHSEFQSVFD